MKIQTIQMKNFRRFTDLTIEALPKTARLVVMIGPNGSGKSSVFDALLKVKNANSRLSNVAPDDYYVKFGTSKSDYTDPEIEFHTETYMTPEEWKKAVHMRSSYRNDLIDSTSEIYAQAPPLTSSRRFLRLSQNDQSVASNYSRILNLLLERTSATERRGENIGDVQDEIYGELITAIDELFKDPQLTLAGLGSPKNMKIFQLDKGTSHGFTYHNLSSGEKAALDLLLDVIVAKAEFDDTVFCIDEPEAHIHTKLQGPLLEELYKLIPDNSQLWIATHSIGMVRKAQDLWRENPDSVVFLDFGDEKLNFDEEVTIKPTSPNPDFWARTYEIALGDLAELVLTERTVFCEGRGFDAECYRKIFRNRYPEISFNPLEGRDNVLKTVEAANLTLQKISKSAMVIGIVDQDDATPDDIERRKKNGIRTLSRRTIENFLLDDEVLSKLCEDYGEPDKVDDLLAAKQEGLDKHNLKSDDILKAIVQPIHGAAKTALNPAKLGVSRESFMMDILAPLIKPGMTVYDQLHDDIFGEYLSSTYLSTLKQHGVEM